MAWPHDRKINSNISKTYIHLSKRRVHILQKLFSAGYYLY